jgi:phosphatidylglycerol:prolipoprotein diacylglycerol transferase
MNPILLKTDFFELPAYRFFIAAGGVLSFFLLKRFQKEMGLRRKEDFWLLVNIIAISSFVGARLMFILIETPAVATHFWQHLFAINSGFSVFGFISGALISAYFCGKMLKLDPARLADYICLFIPLWLILARFGCVFNGCCVGLPARHLPWAITFTNPQSAVPKELLGVPLHPVQLYEIGGNILLMAFLFVVLRNIRQGRYPHGLICASYLVGYGILRFILEWFRANTKPFFDFITVGQMLALGLLALGIFLGFICRRQNEFQQNQINPTIGLKVS